MKKHETTGARVSDELRPLQVLARLVPQPVDRPPQGNIPPTRAEREAFRRRVEEYLARGERLVPPVPIDELRRRSEEFLEREGIERRYLEFTAVLVNNALWRERLAQVPYDRRLLLLPKCLRVESHCPAPFDELGLLCKKCGMCTIQELQDEAERLGYAVLVAEGSPVVMAIIETGKIEAIVGVSCLNVLERAFPYMEAAAIPGVAVPLLQDDCKDTGVDMDWVWDVIHLTSADRTRRLDLGALREEVDGWFRREALAATLGEPASRTEEIACEWLGRAGKRWRPLLAVAVHQALQDDPGGPIPPGLRQVAVAVECFHKASLIHDDIEDQDSTRYGRRTLHEEHGLAVALNTGDFLLGEGYRLLGECDAPGEVRARMLQVAAGGHRTLSLGQGAELCWARDPTPLATRQVLEIFRQKTAPAFEVALRLGAAYAGAGAEVEAVLGAYSESLGIAYQIRDDLEDLEALGTTAPGAADDPLRAARPNLLLAIACERARKDERRLLAALWRRPRGAGVTPSQVRTLLKCLGAEERARELLEAYRDDAARALWKLDNANLKGLLRRVVSKIFGDAEIQGWCHEFEARNAPGRAAGAESA